MAVSLVRDLRPRQAGPLGGLSIGRDQANQRRKREGNDFHHRVILVRCSKIFPPAGGDAGRLPLAGDAHFTPRSARSLAPPAEVHIDLLLPVREAVPGAEGPHYSPGNGLACNGAPACTAVLGWSAGRAIQFCRRSR